MKLINIFYVFFLVFGCQGPKNAAKVENVNESASNINTFKSSEISKKETPAGDVIDIELNPDEAVIQASDLTKVEIGIYTATLRIIKKGFGFNTYFSEDERIRLNDPDALLINSGDSTLLICSQTLVRAGAPKEVLVKKIL
ncbi:MAG: hypothetical protein HRT61_22885 [Ekhidna sp.]|nr:hypothetical protein [Ekhidna sp.]